MVNREQQEMTTSDGRTLCWAEFGLEAGRPSIAAERQLADWRPAQRHLYLGTVGTVPAMRGRGLARRTLSPTLTLADNECIPAFLETSAESNIDFYSTLHFEVIDHRRLADGGPNVWAMLRPPQAVQAR
jgi:GNAT superfamily N-acetyltransferase